MLPVGIFMCPSHQSPRSYHSAVQSLFCCSQAALLQCMPSQPQGLQMLLWLPPQISALQPAHASLERLDAHIIFFGADCVSSLGCAQRVRPATGSPHRCRRTRYCSLSQWRRLLSRLPTCLRVIQIPQSSLFSGPTLGHIQGRLGSGTSTMFSLGWASMQMSSSVKCTVTVRGAAPIPWGVLVPRCLVQDVLPAGAGKGKTGTSSLYTDVRGNRILRC